VSGTQGQIWISGQQMRLLKSRPEIKIERKHIFLKYRINSIFSLTLPLFIEVSGHVFMYWGIGFASFYNFVI